MRAAYTGHEALTFMDYVDQATGRVLHAAPGGVYDVVPASGRAVEELPAGWFTPALPPAPAKASTPAKAAPEA